MARHGVRHCLQQCCSRDYPNGTRGFTSRFRTTTRVLFSPPLLPCSMVYTARWRRLLRVGLVFLAVVCSFCRTLWSCKSLFYFSYRFYVDLCLPSVTLVMAKRGQASPSSFETASAPGRTSDLVADAKVFIQHFLSSSPRAYPFSAIFVRWSWMTWLWKSPLTPAFLLRTRFPTLLSASKKRAAPKDSEKVRSFYFSSELAQFLIERSLCSSIPDALRLSVYRMPLFLALTLIALLINAFGICSGDTGAPASSSDSKRARTSSSAPVFAFGDSQFIVEGVYFLPSYFRVPDTDLALFLASSLVRDNQHVQICSRSRVCCFGRVGPRHGGPN